MKSVFVSSTFRDMQAERDVLAHKVIPQLNVYAREFGENIRFVDLRWGVNTAELESDEGSKKVLKVCLDEIDNTRPYMIILIGERYGWIPPVEMIKTAAESKNHSLYDYEKSVTELEIEYGALAEKGQLEQCLFYFREPLERDQIPSEAQGAYMEADALLEAKLSALKEKIKAAGASVKSYRCAWNAENGELSVPESFAEMVQKDVAGLFERDFEKQRGLSWQEREEISARLFAEQKAAQFAGRYPVLESIKEAVCAKETRLYILSGEAGSGKSTMMAKLLSELGQQNETFFFSCGNSRASQTGFDMLKQAVYKLERLLGVEKSFGDREPGEEGEQAELSGQNKPEEWTKKFREYACLYAQTVRKPLYLLFDALDQLTKSELVEKFSWLPSSLPQGVTVVVSCLNSFTLPTFFPLQNESKIEHLSTLSSGEIPQIIESIVRFHGKELSDVVAESIANLPGCENPLYISMALQRLLMLDSDDFADIAAGGNDMDAINAFMLNLIAGFPATAEDMAVLVLGEATERVDERFCYYLVILLAFSRRGLRETDLEGIFTMWDERFSRVDLSLFTNYLSNFFLRRDDGRLDFTHRVIREGILNRADDNAFNTVILEHFKSLDAEDGVRLSEIVWHAYMADDKDFLSDYIEDIKENMSAAAMMAASELHDIALHNPEWVQELIQYAILEKECDHFVNFINFDFFRTFIPSRAEYGILAPVMDACTEAFWERFVNCPMPQNERILATGFVITGHIYKILGKHEEAMILQEKALQINERLDKWTNTPESLLDLSISYDRVAGVYKTKGQYEDALSMYEKSLKIRKHLAEEQNTLDSLRHLSIAYNNMGDIYKTFSRYEEAFDVYEEALRINERLQEERNTPESLLHLSISYSRVGSIYKIRGNYSESLGMYDKALQICERLAEELNTPESHQNLSVSYNKVGDIYKIGGKQREALNVYEKALRINERLAEELNTPESLQDLSSGYTRVGDIYIDLSKNEEALNVYEKALRINERLQEERNTPESLQDLSFSYTKMGGIYIALSKNEEALSMFEKSLQIDKRIVEAQSTPESLRDLSIAYCNVGDVYKSSGKNEEALDMYEKSFMIMDRLAEERNTPESSRDLSIICYKMGGICKALGRHEEAQAMRKKADEIEKSLKQN